jgi:translation initiation factor 4E
MWEDEHCKDGGRWSIRVPKTHTNKYWEDLLLGMIGEQFRVENEILGIAISLRPNQDTISLWLRSGKDKEKIESIKEDIEKLIKIEEGMKLEFENFTESL